MSDPARELHVIFGTGAMGAAILEALMRRGKRVRLINRRGQPSLATGSPVGVEFRAADVSDPASAAAAAVGATHIYQAAQPDYHEWVEKFPPMQRGVMHAATVHQARLIVVENLYMYGDTQGRPLTEDLPHRPTARRKGVVRTQMTEALLAAHRAGQVRVVMGRGADFYGPGYMVMGEQVFYPALAGKRASGIGDLDAPHTFTYTRDFGEALVILGETDDAFGQAWHVPSPEPITQRELIGLAFAAAGTESQIGAINGLMMRLAGLFVPGAREMVEMMYEFNQPFIMDSSRFQQRFGMRPTPHRDAIRATVDWFRAHPLNGAH